MAKFELISVLMIVAVAILAIDCETTVRSPPHRDVHLTSDLNTATTEEMANGDFSAPYMYTTNKTFTHNTSKPKRSSMLESVEIPCHSFDSQLNRTITVNILLDLTDQFTNLSARMENVTKGTEAVMMRTGRLRTDISFIKNQTQHQAIQIENLNQKLKNMSNIENRVMLNAKQIEQVNQKMGNVEDMTNALKEKVLLVTNNNTNKNNRTTVLSSGQMDSNNQLKNEMKQWLNEIMVKELNKTNYQLMSYVTNVTNEKNAINNRTTMSSSVEMDKFAAQFKNEMQQWMSEMVAKEFNKTNNEIMSYVTKVTNLTENVAKIQNNMEIIRDWSSSIVDDINHEFTLVKLKVNEYHEGAFVDIDSN